MKRFRVSLRLLLLIVALFAVCFALVRAQLDLRLTEVERQRIDIQSQILHEEWRQRFYQEQLITVQNMPGRAQEIAMIQRELNDCDAKIKELQTQLERLE